MFSFLKKGRPSPVFPYKDPSITVIPKVPTNTVHPCTDLDFETAPVTVNPLYPEPSRLQHLVANYVNETEIPTQSK